MTFPFFYPINKIAMEDKINMEELFKFYFKHRLGYSILPREEYNRMQDDAADFLIDIYRLDEITGAKYSLILYPTNTKTFIQDMKVALYGLYLDMEL